MLFCYSTNKVKYRLFFSPICLANLRTLYIKKVDRLTILIEVLFGPYSEQFRAESEMFFDPRWNWHKLQREWEKV
jgi:hypothetical protein